MSSLNCFRDQVRVPLPCRMSGSRKLAMLVTSARCGRLLATELGCPMGAAAGSRQLARAEWRVDPALSTPHQLHSDGMMEWVCSSCTGLMAHGKLGCRVVCSSLPPCTSEKLLCPLDIFCSKSTRMKGFIYIRLKCDGDTTDVYKICTI